MSDVREKSADEVFCHSCGAIIKKEAEICPKCGVRQKGHSGESMEKSDKWLLTLLLSIFVGYLGIHRFYVGKTGTGILMLLTAGGCGIWALIDIITIAVGSFTDSDGNYIKQK